MADLTSDLGTTPFLLIYTGSAPANCGTAASGTLLGTLPCSNPFAAAPSGGVLTANAITSATAAAGTAGYWRLCTSSAGTTVVAQGNVGTSGADLNFAGGDVFTSGGTIAVTSFTITATGA